MKSENTQIDLSLLMLTVVLTMGIISLVLLTA